jgi:hypothetical protein
MKHLQFTSSNLPIAYGKSGDTNLIIFTLRHLYIHSYSQYMSHQGQILTHCNIHAFGRFRCRVCAFLPVILLCVSTVHSRRQDELIPKEILKSWPCTILFIVQRDWYGIRKKAYYKYMIMFTRLWYTKVNWTVLLYWSCQRLSTGK